MMDSWQQLNDHTKLEPFSLCQPRLKLSASKYQQTMPIPDQAVPLYTREGVDVYSPRLCEKHHRTR